MEQTTPPPTKPVMDIARPKSAIPTTPLRPPASSVAPAPVTPLAATPVPTPQPTSAAPASTPPTHPQLAVRKAPTSDEEPSGAVANNDVHASKTDSKDHKKDSPAAFSPAAHPTVPKNSTPHAPVGAIVLTVLVMIMLSAVAIMIYLNSQK